jgi:hypothetical protein
MNTFLKLRYILFTILGCALLYYLFFKNKETNTIEYDTALIEQQVKNVSKLVVTEGHFAEVITYKDQKKYMGDLLSFEKKAIVVINADVSIVFDLKQLEYDINKTTKTISITNLPKEEVKISPDFKYYDTEESTFNEFTGEDYNKINKIARENLKKKINQSSLKQNAKTRLLEELSNLFSFAEKLGWTVSIEGNTIKKGEEIQTFLK